MANIQFSRMILKSSTGTFSIPNVPENINEYDYLVDGNFESSDLLDCELGVDKTNEKLYLRIDDEIVEVGGGGGSVSLSDGNGTTYNVDRVDLGGVLRSNDTIIKGATDSTSSLFLGGNAGGENLIQLSINAESLITQNLISYTGSNIGTYLNSNPGGFISHNNISLMSGVEAYTSIGNGGDTAYVRYNDNRIIDFYFWGGVPTGLGEWFSINGATFSEGVDFTGSGDPYVDVMTFYTGLNWGIDPTFISVEYDGDLSIRLKYSQPVKIEGLITGISFNENLYFTAALANGAGGAILYSDQSTLSINDFGDHTFTDGRIIKKGIEYTADYSATFVTHSLVDKQYVDNAIIGASTFSVDYIDFNTSYTPTQQEGRLHWDADYGTLDVDLEGNNINLKVGLDTLYYIKNQSGSTINKGSVVRASGTLGSSGRILGGLMIANGSMPHYYTLGIAGENISNGEDGYVYHFGLIKNMDTTGVPYGETWVDGDILYVSSTTPGGLTKVEPIEPNLKIQMAIVIDADNNGSIFIRPDLGSSLGDIHNIQTTGQSDGDLISYNQPGGYWEYTKELNGDYTISGTLSATAYYGDGSNLTGIVDTNFSNTDLTLTGTRTHNLNGNILNINNGATTYFRINEFGDIVGRGKGDTTNTHFGLNVLRSNSTGVQNTIYGQDISGITSGQVNAYFGYRSGRSNNGSGNVFFGGFSGLDLTTGNNNVIIGRSAAFSTNAGGSVTNLENSIVIGETSRVLNSGDTNTIIIGRNSRGYGSNTAVLGNSDITLTRLRGRVEMDTITSAPTITDNSSYAIWFNSNVPTIRIKDAGGVQSDIAINDTNLGNTNLTLTGTRTLNLNGNSLSFINGAINDVFLINSSNDVLTRGKGGSNCNFFGFNTGRSSTGADNSAFGDLAGSSLTSAIGTTLIGRSAGAGITNGTYTVAIGRSALLSATGNAVENTVVGSLALSSLISTPLVPRNNVAIGYNAGSTLINGNYNTYLGSNTQPLNTATSVNEIIIGSDTTGYGSNTAVLGNNNITLTRLKGRVEANTITVAPTITDNNSYAIWFNGSTPTIRLKDGGGTQTDLGLITKTTPVFNKTITLEAPTATEDISLFRTDIDITVQEVVAVSTGTSPSTTYVLRHSTDRNATGNLLTTSGTTTSTTTGNVATLSDATIPANSWIWLETTAASGTNVKLTIDIRYTID